MLRSPLKPNICCSAVLTWSVTRCEETSWNAFSVETQTDGELKALLLRGRNEALIFMAVVRFLFSVLGMPTHDHP